jgi:uncharacterized damage-inducible protein DinB
MKRSLAFGQECPCKRPRRTIRQAALPFCATFDGMRSFSTSARSRLCLSTTLPIFFLAAASAPAQAPELGLGWLAEFNLAARQILALAEATPAEKFAWRPSPGVRSVSEVYMHIAVGNYFLLDQAGVKIPDDTPPIGMDLEKKTTSKRDVIQWLERSFEAVRAAYPKTGRTAKRTFLKKQTTSGDILLRLLVHAHEHMGQSTAYARMIGVVPPGSSANQ